MNNQITALRILVSDTLNPHSHLKSNADIIDKYCLELSSIETQIFSAIRAEIYGASKANVVERHIRQIQTDCIELMDLLHGYAHRDEELKDLHGAVFKCLQRVLNEIEQHHFIFFNPKATLPSAYHHQAVEALETEFTLLKTVLKKNKLEPAWYDHIERPISRFLKAGCCTFEQLSYMNGLISSLVGIQSDSDKFFGNLTKKLVYHRFNDPELGLFYISVLEEEINVLYSMEEQYERLSWYKKEFKRQEEQSSCCFDPSGKSLKVLLMDYIEGELEFIERKQIGGRERNNGTAGRSLSENNYRLKVSLSADGLAYLIRLMVEADLIVAKPRTLLMEFVAKYFQTCGIGTANLSARSLETKYKQVTQNTAKGVSAALKRMLRLLDQQFILFLSLELVFLQFL